MTGFSPLPSSLAPKRGGDFTFQAFVYSAMEPEERLELPLKQSGLQTVFLLILTATLAVCSGKIGRKDGSRTHKCLKDLAPQASDLPLAYSPVLERLEGIKPSPLASKATLAILLNPIDIIKTIGASYPNLTGVLSLPKTSNKHYTNEARI